MREALCEYWISRLLCSATADIPLSGSWAGLWLDVDQDLISAKTFTQGKQVYTTLIWVEKRTLECWLLSFLGSQIVVNPFGLLFHPQEYLEETTKHVIVHQWSEMIRNFARWQHFCCSVFSSYSAHSMLRTLLPAESSNWWKDSLLQILSIDENHFTPAVSSVTRNN